VSGINSDNLENHIIRTVNRLRLIQVDFADETEETRNGYLGEEIERALKIVLPDQRKEFLEKLTTRFPVGSFGSKVISDESTSPVSQADVPIDSELLVRSLVEIAPTLSDENKQLIVKSLGQQTVTPAVEADYSEQSLKQLQTVLETGEAGAIRADRLMELSTMLAGLVCKVEPLVWNVWKKLSPRSSIRHTANLKDIMGKFLFSDQDASREQIDEELKQLQWLIAAIITAISQVGGQFARNHLAKFSPSEIAALVKVEQGSVFVSHEVKCWRKYLELAGTLNEDSIDTEIKDAIVGYVESLRNRMGR
jgi:hypothetical protein